jgi:hypothetical protein
MVYEIKKGKPFLKNVKIFWSNENHFWFDHYFTLK